MSAGDPQEPDDIFIGNGGFLITNLSAMMGWLLTNSTHCHCYY